MRSQELGVRSQELGAIALELVLVLVLDWARLAEPKDFREGCKEPKEQHLRLLEAYRSAC